MASPLPENIMVWNAVIFGPEDTPFEDGKRYMPTLQLSTKYCACAGTFKLVLTFDETYPNKPPHVRFVSRMFHPNVYADGALCLDILQNRYDAHCLCPGGVRRTTLRPS